MFLLPPNFAIVTEGNRTFLYRCTYTALLKMMLVGNEKQLIITVVWGTMPGYCFSSAPALSAS